ncbi:AAA family ATPase [Thiomicrorhabdus lithotrophica]|uniref:AAA family ATPase n=1 Tax=Thiomicrorhabdus lithotrophica TaxID=2949997 RepID=A0ABY8CBC9_9GAMM|nr:AAA family ATPase [Thiomicrorhabdus lithotrophica]WEJ61876.1 AAA family ATPase [Thiomicrorhabdus lithotrophica]
MPRITLVREQSIGKRLLGVRSICMLKYLGCRIKNINTHQIEKVIMDIIKFRLKNIGRFSEIDVPLAPTITKTSNVTVFVGGNGAGKTSLLKSLSTSLSWFVARLKTEKGNGSPISEMIIKNGKSSSSITIEVSDKKGIDFFGGECKRNFEWVVAKTKRSRKAEYVSELKDASELANLYRDILEASPDESLPLIAYYPVERTVLDIPLKIRSKHTFSQIDGYDNSLNRGVDFRRFFEWFREREDSENEAGLSSDVLKKMSEMFGENNLIWDKLNELNASSRDVQLVAVREAIKEFMPGFDNLRVQRKPRLHMAINKDGETLNVAQLSQGEKSLMALVGDIARRLAMMNPSLENPLLGDGIVLIDEVDLHLHPKWQRTLISRLTGTFKNCQFVLTTHSPLVISDYKDVLCYVLDDGELIEESELYGLDANEVLLGVMDTSIRNESVDRKLKDLLDAIQDSKFDLSSSLISELESDISPTNIELIKAKLFLKKQILRHEKNN